MAALLGLPGKPQTGDSCAGARRCPPSRCRLEEDAAQTRGLFLSASTFLLRIDGRTGDRWRRDRQASLLRVEDGSAEIARQCRQNQREADLMAPFLDDDVLRSVVESVATDSTPESDNRRIQLIGLVQFTLDQLPEHYAAALELKYIEGCNSKEIAQRLRISDEATQSLLARARRAFREVCGVALRTAM